MQIFEQEEEICETVSVGYDYGEFFAWHTVTRPKEAAFVQIADQFVQLGKTRYIADIHIENAVFIFIT